VNPTLFRTPAKLIAAVCLASPIGCPPRAQAEPPAADAPASPVVQAAPADPAEPAAMDGLSDVSDAAAYEIVVTGTRTERKRADEPGRTEIITREEIERSGARRSCETE